jgi:hypothetical protein
MPNITLAMDEELLKSARSFARSEGTTLNALVRKLVAEAIEQKQRREEARLKLIELMRTSTARLPPNFKINRDEMYGSPAFSRHEHPSVRRRRKG